MRTSRYFKFSMIIGLVAVIAVSLILFIHNEQETVLGLDNKHDKPEGFINHYYQISKVLDQSHSGYETNYKIREFEKLKMTPRLKSSSLDDFLWAHRGPGNVGGRTKQVIIDPDDITNKTWFAASAGGGLWKTTDAGESWNSLTDDLPNLATNAVAMAPSNSNILYLGTGEGYGGVGMISGSGIFKSLNKGNSWELLTSTINNPNFRWINKIVVSKINPEEVIVATNSGIFKTYDGGASWSQKYNAGTPIQDLAVNVKNSNTIYASAQGLGIIKSYNNGESWRNALSGLGTGNRYSVSVSPVDTNYVYTAVEKATEETEVYISENGGAGWQKLNDGNGKFINFLGSQGWYNNIIKAHPFHKNKVFVAGVYMGLLEFTGDKSLSLPDVMRADTSGTSSFLGFVNFGGPFLGGGMSTGFDEDAIVTSADFTSVELRFGPGLSQKAYRFTVPVGASSGVPAEDYTYHDYIEVPFEVWDVEDNKQLMVSFRDQERDGEFNLIERDDNDDVKGREYIFIQAVEYSETPDTSIAKDGGHIQKMIYFFWPTLVENGIWEPESLLESEINITYGPFDLQAANTTLITDPEKDNPIHVDHHDLVYKITDPDNEGFMLLNANDGGLAVSYSGGNSWSQINSGYHTAQFYGVAKRPYADQFIGGLQDNGTYMSKAGEDASSLSEFDAVLGGDGFEVLWHPTSTNKIIGSIYNNGFRLSTDGGETWRYAVSGIGASDGPFISRLSHSRENPDLIFAVGERGVYKHPQFAFGRDDWELVNIGNGWIINDQLSSSQMVRVSLADPSVVWAGGGMFEEPYLSLFVSKDYGETFEAVSLYNEREMGYISGLATHPSDPATAYALFSIDHRPKILRTTNFGESWKDITGFGQDSTSSNGFPDVRVYSLLVHKFDPNYLWAGTEIGLMESPDNGETWYYADNGLPAVAIWQMFIQDAQIVVATHGRGIWTAPQWPGAIDGNAANEYLRLKTYPNPSQGIVNVEIDSDEMGEYVLEVYNTNGSMVYTENGSKYQHTLDLTADLSDLQNGNYIIMMRMKGKSYSGKVNIIR